MRLAGAGGSDEQHVLAVVEIVAFHELENQWLVAGTVRVHNQAMRKQPRLQRLIPVTALRHLYQLLRDFPKEKFQLKVCEEICRRPNQLIKLVAKSRDHFALYDNHGEAFHNRGAEGQLTPNRQNNFDLANRVVQQLALNERPEINVVDAPQYGFQYVDYDISPWRTTRSEFENGKSGSSSGAGGIDLLLCDPSDRTPIIGEIKADTDVNPFLGLIQSLMYAVELSTPAQRVRLNRHYPERFAECGTEAGIDIYLILLRYPQDEISQEFLRLTSQLSASLMADNTVAGMIRRIVALESPMTSDRLDNITVAFAHRQCDVARQRV